MLSIESMFRSLSCSFVFTYTESTVMFWVIFDSSETDVMSVDGSSPMKVSGGEKDTRGLRVKRNEHTNNQRAVAAERMEKVASFVCNKKRLDERSSCRTSFRFEGKIAEISLDVDDPISRKISFSSSPLLSTHTEKRVEKRVSETAILKMKTTSHFYKRTGRCTTRPWDKSTGNDLSGFRKGVEIQSNCSCEMKRSFRICERRESTDDTAEGDVWKLSADP